MPGAGSATRLGLRRCLKRRSPGALVVSGSFDQTDHWQVAPAHSIGRPRHAWRAAAVAPGNGGRHWPGAANHQAFGSVAVALDTFRTGFYQQGLLGRLARAPQPAGFRIYRGGQLVYERWLRARRPAWRFELRRSCERQWCIVALELVDRACRTRPTRSVSRKMVDRPGRCLAVDQTDSAIAIPPAGLKGGPPTLVEVQASDGVRVTRAPTRWPAP